MSISNALNPLVVKTELDAVFVQEMEMPVGPGIATALSSEIFHQMDVDNSAHIEAILSGGGGFWSAKGEEQAVPQSSPRVANKITFSVSTWANGLTLSKEFFDDQMHGTYTSMVRKFAEAARATRDRNAFGLFRGAFTTTLTADGVALISASHTTIDGGTVSNLLSGGPALSETSLNNAIVQLLEMKSQDGIVLGQQPSVLLVPSKLFKLAMELTQSALVASSANNAVNVFSSAYNIAVRHSPYLGAANGGSDTAWFLMSRNHSITRYIREEVSTSLVDFVYSSNDNYVYKGRFREVYGASDYSGVVGSLGTGG